MDRPEIGLYLLPALAALLAFSIPLLKSRRRMAWSVIASFTVYLAGAVIGVLAGGMRQTVIPLVLAGMYVALANMLAWLWHLKSASQSVRLHAMQMRMLLDPLTRVHNRLYFDRSMSRAALAPPNRELTLFFIDFDYFKSVNDTYGHAVGDKVLVHFARVLKRHIRKADDIVRLGGEEFAVLAWHDGSLQVEQYATRLQTAVASEPCRITEGINVPMTISIGVATCNPLTERVESCVDKADEAMYKAKNRGRNHVVMA